MADDRSSDTSRLDRLLGYDEALLVAITRRQLPRLTWVMKALTRLGDAESWVLMGFAVLTTAGPQAALRLSVGALGATIPAHILKRVLRRKRPTITIPGWVALDADPDAFSFPSGHTATSFGVALTLLACHSVLAGPALVLATAIGLSRVYLGAHYPLDVMAGALLGGFGALVCRLLLG
jgi:undecaprenyl-diphosphatase